MPKPDSLSGRFSEGDATDPRETESAQIIDLTTRQVLPQVAARKPKSDAASLAAGIAIVAALGAVTLWSMNSVRNPETQAQTDSAQPAVQPPAAQAPAVPPEAITPAPGTNLEAPAPTAVLSAPPQTATSPMPVANPYSSPTVVFDASALPVPALAIPAPGAGEGTAAGGNPNDAFASRLGGVGGATAVASASLNPQTTVTQGTLIPAVLETAIDTDVPGYVRAVVSADVRSFDGTRVLVPRSSRLIGQYSSGLQAGQRRAYVIWTRLIRPDGVSVNIASPAIGFSGETGLAGKVDSRFFERFGSAMLLSVIGGLSAIGGNGAVVVAGGGQSAAAAAIGQTGQVSPTVRVRAGEPVRVFTARDLDFSKVATQ
jgi:type IV secretion system protein VirB10